MDEDLFEDDKVCCPNFLLFTSLIGCTYLILNVFKSFVSLANLVRLLVVGTIF